MRIKHDRSPIEQTLAAEVDPDCSLCDGYSRDKMVFPDRTSKPMSVSSTLGIRLAGWIAGWCQDNIMPPQTRHVHTLRRVHRRT